ncbi:unnamed protein product [Candidula unifasciata]|uniref:RING-type domain-containing protein n=1 Tax=Candidula unifasciata TaxID=100452 RepID=A0A8S3ZF71_9EUPU|nr:unnamed protein product [Candidula unifasciata]
MSEDHSISVFIRILTTVTTAVTSVGSFLASYISLIWQGFGFVFSLIASCPAYCVECIENACSRGISYISGLIASLSTETYLGVVGLCLIYFTVSNIFRYVYGKRPHLFPFNFGSRQLQGRTSSWQVDRGFESDFEYLNLSDTEDALWPNSTTVDSNDDNESDDDTDDNVNDRSSDVTDDVSDNTDSDEYTVVMEESDSEGSITSQTYSTESSDHEIEIQLPPVDSHYTLLHRSSTPSLVSKNINSPEDFHREMEREQDKRKCVVCQNLIKSVLILPCRHLCLCVLCANQIVSSGTRARRVCPLCRSRITKVMNIYV